MRHSSLRVVLLLATTMLAWPSLAQDAKNDTSARSQMSENERKERIRNFRKEVGKAYRDWLDQDVRWIITDEEEKAFKSLSNDEERDQFIEAFWQRRDPTPDTEENEFREEHYRRIAYANEHFAAGVAGSRTDRGHIYIVWGPPDEIESHPSGGTSQSNAGEGGGSGSGSSSTSTYPFERWRYRYIEGIGNEVNIEFVDSCMCGDYHISTDPSEKDALLHTPGSGHRQTGAQDSSTLNGGNQFDALERYTKLTAAPPVKFKDLEEKVNTHIRYNLMPFDLRTDFVKVTNDTVLVPITIQIKTRDMTFVQKDGIQRASVNIFGRVSTLSGRVATVFEDTVAVDEPNELLEKALTSSQLYWKALTLKPGLYKLEVAVKDINGDRFGTYARSLRVPEFDEEKLSSSSLILADLLEHVAAKNIGAGNFVIGDTKVRPRLDAADGKPAAFPHQQPLHVYLQVYNLKPEAATKHTRATLTYEISKLPGNTVVAKLDEPATAYSSGGDQITIEKSFSLAKLEPGLYNFKLTVRDDVTQQTIAATARFRVE